MVSIDGTDISGVTIDGTDVQEITIDGAVAWTTIETIFTASDSWTTNDIPQNVLYEQNNGRIYNMKEDSGIEEANNIVFDIPNGTTRTFDFNYNLQNWSGSGSTQGDRRHTLMELRDTSGNLILDLAIQPGNQTLGVWDTTMGNPGWQDLGDSSAYTLSNLSPSQINNFKIYYNGSNWIVNVNNGQWAYTNQNFNNPVGLIRCGGRHFGNHGSTVVHEWGINENL